MKKTLLFMSLFVFILACGEKKETPSKNGKKESIEKPAKVDNGLGVGAYTKVALNDPLNQEMVAKGKAVYEMKCAACHKLKGSRIVGPSWAGVTSKRKPEWIMNMVTNVEVMLAEDPTAQKLLEECLTRMPNQNVSKEDARALLEFMYQNDIDNAK